MNEVAEQWRETWADLAPKTRVGYDSILARHVLPAFGSSKVAGITPRDVQEFANGLAAGRSPNTVRRVMDVLRNVLRVAVERRYIAVSPADAVKLPRKGGERGIEINPLTHAEVRALIAALPEWWRLPVLLDVYTGLRAGELWALRRRDVDTLRGELSIANAIKEVTTASAAAVPEEQRLSPSLIIGPTKTYARRKVSLPEFVKTALAEQLTRPLPGGVGPDAFLFTTPTGEPVRHNLFYKRVYAPAVQELWPGRALRFHDLRRTCAAWLIAAGAHPLHQAPPRPRGHQDDHEHLRPPVPLGGARVGRAARRGLPRRGRQRDAAAPGRCSRLISATPPLPVQSRRVSTLDYSHTLDALVGWIDQPVRVTAYDSTGNSVLVLNGNLRRAPDAAEEPNDEVRFFCVGHDDPRDGADGFFLPAATFRHGMYMDPPLGTEPKSVLLVALEGGTSLVIERGPT